MQTNNTHQIKQTNNTTQTKLNTDSKQFGKQTKQANTQQRNPGEIKFAPGLFLDFLKSF